MQHAYVPGRLADIAVHCSGSMGVLEVLGPSDEVLPLVSAALSSAPHASSTSAASAAPAALNSAPEVVPAAVAAAALAEHPEEDASAQRDQQGRARAATASEPPDPDGDLYEEVEAASDGFAAEAQGRGVASSLHVNGASLQDERIDAAAVVGESLTQHVDASQDKNAVDGKDKAEVQTGLDMCLNDTMGLV